MGEILDTSSGLLTIRPLNRTDERAVLDLVRLALYGENFPDLPGYWQWKHYENPFGESFGLVAWAGEQLAAVRLFMRWSLCGGGQVVRVGRAVDMAVHPDWRRRGLFERMTLASLEPMAAEGIALTYNTPNSLSLPGYLKMGWSHPGRLPLRMHVRHPGRVLGHVVRAQLGHDAAGRKGLTPSGGKARPVKAVGLVDNTQVLCLLQDVAVRELTQRVGAAQLDPPSRDAAVSRLRTVLSPEYLEWHYGRNHWYPYVAAFESRGNEGALVVGRLLMRQGLVEVWLTEVVASPGRRGRALAARAAARLACQTRADYVVVSALGETPGVRRGYLPLGRRGTDVTVRVLMSDLPLDPTSWAGWAAGIGDFELF